MTDSLASECRAAAAEAARGVAPLLREGFRSAPEIGYKADLHDMVTEFDRTAEDRIRATLRASFPSSSVVGEERGPDPHSSLVWYVDPIDGTSNFARGIPFWCVSIAAVVEGITIAGVVLDPAHDDLFHADDEGAWEGERELTATGRVRQEEATLLTGFPSPGDVRGDRAAALAEYGELVETFAAVRNPTSAALCLAHVAAGWADAVLDFDVHSWDVAAGSHLVRRAGGRYRSWRGGIETPGASIHDPAFLATVRDADLPLLERIAPRASGAR